MTWPAQQVWDGVLRRLEEELPSFAVEAWLRPVEAERDGECLRLLCPTALHRRRVEEHYRPRIAECAAGELGRPVTVRVETRAAHASAAGFSATAPPRAARAASHVVRPAPAQQRTLPYTFDSFIVGAGNTLAREASWAIAQRSPLAVSPLYLVSSPGLGKTHLARAVVTESRSRSSDAALYVSSEQFTSEFMAALRSRSMTEFKRRYRRQCDLLVVDDVQFLAGKKATQLELFHTLESLREQGARVVLTATGLPRELDGLDARLVSRMSCGLVAEIELPSSELRREILRAKAASGGIRLPAECLDRLVEAVPGSIRDLESSLIQLVASASLLKRPIDLELTEGALRKVLPARLQPTRLDSAQVIQVVVSFFGTNRESLASPSRRREVLLPRKLAMYLCRRYTDASLKQIGRAFGRDHPSVTNAISSVERALLERAPLRYQLELLTARLDAIASAKRAQCKRSAQ